MLAHDRSALNGLVLQGLEFTGIVVRTPAVPGEELCVCGDNHVCESRDCATVVYPIRHGLFVIVHNF